MTWIVLALVLVAVLGVVATRWRIRRSLPEIPQTADELLQAMASAESVGRLLGDAPGTPFPGPAARRWAYGVLHEAGVDADADPSYAAGLLQRAEPRLSRIEADALIRMML